MRCSSSEDKMNEDRFLNSCGKLIWLTQTVMYIAINWYTYEARGITALVINCAFRMNLDAPETRLVGAPIGQLEEGRDQLEIRCLADANPPASILWRKTKSPGVTEVASIGETLMFSPIYRNHAAVYLCEASNIEGESSPVSVQVSVNCTCIAVTLLSKFCHFLPLALISKFSRPWATTSVAWKH